MTVYELIASSAEKNACKFTVSETDLVAEG
jgi:hypothetical protein